MADRATAPDPAPAVSRDARLRLARRIDWRFLLPSPELGPIDLRGAPDDDLRAAIDALDGPSGGAPARPGSVVLAGRPDRAGISAAARAVPVGGQLVVELDGPLAPLLERRRGAGLGMPARLARALEAGGFAVRTYLAWPAIGRATAFAAIDDPVALRALAARRLGVDATSPLVSIAGLLAGTALLSSASPATIVVAQRGPIRPGLIERRIGSRTSPAGSRANGLRREGLLVLAPRYRASAHVVGLALGGDGSVRRVAKVARLRDDHGLEHEAAVLARLGRTAGAVDSGPSLLDAPGLPAAVGDDPWPILVERGIDGRPLDPGTVRADRAAAMTSIERWLATLPVAGPSARSLGVGPRLHNALEAVARLADDGPAGRRLAALVDRSRPVVDTLAGVPLPVVLEHGDPAHPNLVRRPDGRLAAVDWERGEPDGLPLHDHAIAVAYVAAAEAGASSAADQARAFRAALTGERAWAASVLDRELDRIGVERSHRTALVVAAWLRSAAWLAEHLRGGSDAVGTGDLATWLADDRSVALWAAALDLAVPD